MPLRDYVTRPQKLSAIQWNTDNDRSTIEGVLDQYGFLHEHHEDEFLTPDHIIFGDLHTKGILLKHQFLVITEDGQVGPSDAEKMERECMTQEDYDAMLSELARNMI